jgi:hypothetical protein
VGRTATGVVVGWVVPPEGSTVMPMRSPGVTARARIWASWSRPAERASEGVPEGVPEGPITQTW